MDWVDWARAAFALLATLALVGLAGLGARRLNMLGNARLGGADKRLKVVESLMLDPRRKLIIVQHDEREHLILLSPMGDRVVLANAKLGEGRPS
ncbi:MAG: flagellar biosynthetic protein FliO [Hyphomonadaceae bacterium]|nr:flagellar biosynthetic protein FliO [Hyphomonadaceae bacterium]